MGVLKKQRRLLALWFQRLPTDRLKRHKPQTSGPLPLVVAEKVQNALRLSAVDQAATQLGLYIGQPLANARAMVPELEVVAADRLADAHLLEQLADWCDRFTPAVALDPPDGLFLDITGAAHLFGGEKKLLGRICSILRARSFTVQAAIAGTAKAAHALARHRDGCIVEKGAEAQAVSPLPIEALQLGPVITHAFRRAGLKTIGQAAGRKRSEIVSRFGAATLTVMDEALGQGERPISPRRLLPDFWQTENFAEPVLTLDVILIALQSLATKLSAVMEREGVGARRLEASFFRSDGAIRRIAVEAGGPVRAVPVIGRLFQERLASLADPLDPGFGFDLIRLAALRVERMETRASSFDAAAQVQDEINFLIDRLEVRFGRGRVVRFYPQDSHVPENAWLAAPAQNRRETAVSWQAVRSHGEAPRRPLRLFTPPESIEVRDMPLRLQWRKAWHAITQWEGPERIAMEWWRHEKLQAARDYYRAEDETGRHYWVYRDLSTVPPKWFLHGVFA
jgi:protein ImuB